MNSGFFNFHSTIASDFWEQRSFISRWWSMYRNDPRWVPPYYPALLRELDVHYNQHLERMNPFFFFAEALPHHKPVRGGYKGTISQDAFVSGAFTEVSVSAAVGLLDPRRRDRNGYLALFKVANDLESLERLVDSLYKAMQEQGCRGLIAPTGLSPYLGSGLLQDGWTQIPPLHSAYNPPYLPDLASSVFKPYLDAHLYRLEIDHFQPTLEREAEQNVELIPFDPLRLARDLLPLFLAAFGEEGHIFPLPDQHEAAYLLRQVTQWPLWGWLAVIDRQASGFVLLQPDLAWALLKAGGGKNLFWRIWLRLGTHKKVDNGLLLFAGVLPEWRKKGVGSKLLAKAIETARQQGWKSITAGPLPDGCNACSYLEKFGAQPAQSYKLYRLELE